MLRTLLLRLGRRRRGSRLHKAPLATRVTPPVLATLAAAQALGLRSFLWGTKAYQKVPSL